MVRAREATKRAAAATSSTDSVKAKRSKLSSNGSSRTKVTNGIDSTSKLSSHRSHTAAPGCVLTLGEGDTGQLGLGPDVMERMKPALVQLPHPVIQVCAGGMHTACLTDTAQVYTFGCNDEGALGRGTPDEDDSMTPGRVELDERIVQLSAGDSHTAFLTEDGRVFACGTFRDANGAIGLVSGQRVEKIPVEMMAGHHVVKLASGTDHLVCLTSAGEIFTLGCADQGQLGRVAECFAVRGGRKGLGHLLTPGRVHTRKRSSRFDDIWTGQYVTYAQEQGTGHVYSWGLNNYYQLGFPDMLNRFVPHLCMAFSRKAPWLQISGGQHHTIALDSEGKVYSLGRKEYGRLGLGIDASEQSALCLVPALADKRCTYINSGTAVSFAITDDGLIYAWGMGSTKQLGQKEEDDIYSPIEMTGKQLENRCGLMVSAGGQHTVLLARDK